MKEKSFNEANMELVKKAVKYAVIIGIIAGSLIALMEAVGCAIKPSDEITFYSCTAGEEIMFGVMTSIIIIPLMIIGIIFLTYLGYMIRNISRHAPL